MMNTYQKLLAALVPLVTFGLSQAGVNLPVDWAMGFTAVVTPILVWALPK